jgi:hypothetical protein
MENENNSKWPYLAGLFDGEGTCCIGTIKGKNAPCFVLYVKIANTDLRLMQWLIKNFGGAYSVSSSKKDKKGHRLQYAWRPSGKANRKRLLENLIPHLVIKKEQAILGLEFDSVYQTGVKLKSTDTVYIEANKKREEIRNKMHNLNHKIKI